MNLTNDPNGPCCTYAAQHPARPAAAHPAYIKWHTLTCTLSKLNLVKQNNWGRCSGRFLLALAMGSLRTWVLMRWFARRVSNHLVLGVAAPRPGWRRGSALSKPQEVSSVRTWRGGVCPRGFGVRSKQRRQLGFAG